MPEAFLITAKYRYYKMYNGGYSAADPDFSLSRILQQQQKRRGKN
jgi:hypothetical protein